MTSLWMQQALEPTGGLSWTNPGGELGYRKAGGLLTATNSLNLVQAPLPPPHFDI